MLSTTQRIVHEIFSTFTGEKSCTGKKDCFYSNIASGEIDKILQAQRSEKTLDYDSAGFAANNITAAIVQRQIASAY